mmetsp:Transcript_6791/g.11328  ORF Transcript_6791/g.11328 Transcript_6791/m.11328 type:complete len:265 (-) Transcript_6791:192-986(-)
MPPARNPNEPLALPQCRAVLREFMCHKNSTNYPKVYEFSDAELGAMSPVDLYRFFCFKACHKHDPGPTDKPMYARANSIEFWKKAMSYFMPNRLASWNYLANPPCGNPTKSKEVNDLIKAVKKKETRKQGRKSKADRAIEPSDFVQTISILENTQDYNKRYRHPAMIKTQFHFIARGDDIAHMKKENIEQSAEHPWTLTAKLRWSKNVSEERDCPKQIVLGANDPKHCVLVAWRWRGWRRGAVWQGSCFWSGGRAEGRGWRYRW